MYERMCVDHVLEEYLAELLAEVCIVFIRGKRGTNDTRVFMCYICSWKEGM